MLDNLIVVKDLNTLEAVFSSTQEAQKTKDRLEEITLQERQLGSQGLPTDYKINMQGSTVTLQGDSVNFALCIAYQVGLLSGAKLTQLGNHVTRLRKEEILSQQAASRTTGLFAARALGHPIPRVTPKLILSEETKAIVAEQRATLAARQARVK